jgi:hypothetical protein
VLSDSSRQDKIRTLRVQYTSLETEINKPKYPRLFIIRQTTLGVTRDVVRLVASNGIKARFSDYHSDISLDKIDKKCLLILEAYSLRTAEPPITHTDVILKAVTNLQTTPSVNLLS